MMLRTHRAFFLLSLLALGLALGLALTSAAHARTAVTADPLVGLALQQAELTGSDGGAIDCFGTSVAIDGDTAVVGAPQHDFGPSADEGAAYVFVRTGAGWTQQIRLSASDGAANDQFGRSVAISGDTALVGAPNRTEGANPSQGAAYVYLRVGTVWTQRAKLTASAGTANSFFGVSVALDGDTALVGADGATVGGHANQGAAYPFIRTDGAWARQPALTLSDGAAEDHFGYALALSGDTALIGAFGRTVGGRAAQGAAYVYTRNGDGWAPQATLTAADGVADDAFATAVALSGDTALVGASDKTVAGSAQQGVAYVFARDRGVWASQAELTLSDGASGDLFGISVAVSGDSALIGARNRQVGTHAGQGAAYVFTRTSSVWSRQETLTAADGGGSSYFGHAVALSDESALVGAYGQTMDAHAFQGAAYVYGLPCTVTPSVAGGHGTISPAAAQRLDYGSAPTFTFTPDAGYHVSAVTVDGSAVTTTGANRYTFPALAADHTISVAFGAGCTVTPSVIGGHGTISPATAQMLDYGSTPTFTFTPDAGYHVGAVRVDGNLVTMTGTNRYAFPALAADHTISVAFGADPRRAPVLARLSPTKAKRGKTVTLTGSRFGATRGASYVKFGKTKATRYVSWSATRIKVKAPRKAKVGWLKVTVTTTAGTSAGKRFKVLR
jgi:hypothetical protein